MSSGTRKGKAWLALAALLGLALPVLLWKVLVQPDAAADEPPRHVAPAVADVTPAAAAQFQSDGAALISAPANSPTPPVAPSAAPTAPTRRITGRVVRAADGSPIEGATVSLEAPSQAAPAGAPRETGRAVVSQATTRAPDGRFEIVDAPTSAFSLIVALSRGWPRTPLTMEIAAGTRDITDLVLTFDSGFLVRGTVRNLRGEPIPRATVSAGVAEGTIADVQGRYELKDVAPLAGVLWLDCTARAPEFEEQSVPVQVPPPPAFEAGADFVLAGLGALEGRLTDTTGAPVPGVDVWTLARRTDERARTLLMTRHAISDEAGRYRVERLPEGPTDVRFGSDFHGTEGAFAVWGFERTIDEADVSWVNPEPWALDGEELLKIHRRHAAWRKRRLAARSIPALDIPAGETTRLDQVLDGGASIEGRVVGEDGTPVADAEVRALINAQHPERRTTERSELDFPSNDLRHSFDHGSDVLRRDIKREWDIEYSARTDANGYYILEHLSNGWKVLVASPPTLPSDTHSVASKPWEVATSGPMTGADLTLSAMTSCLAGVVTDEAGEPLDGVRAYPIFALDAPASSLEQLPPSGFLYPLMNWNYGLTAQGGQLWFGHVPRGTHDMDLVAAGFVTLRDSITIGAPPRTWVMQRSLDLHVIVENAATSARLPRYELIARNKDEIDRWRAGDESLGRLVIERNADVPCDLTITAHGHFPQTLRDVLPSSTDHDHPLRIAMQPRP